MEEGSKKTQRNEEFRCQQDQHQCPVDAQIPFHELSERHDHPHRCAAVGDDVHNAGRVELHGQHLHSDLPEPLGFLIHLLCFLLVRTVDLQRGQSLQVLKKAVSQFRIDSPIFIQKFLCNLLDRNNGNGDQGNTDQQDKACLPVYKGQDNKQCHRRKQAVK